MAVTASPAVLSSPWVTTSITGTSMTALSTGTLVVVSPSGDRTELTGATDASGDMTKPFSPNVRGTYTLYECNGPLVHASGVIEFAVVNSGSFKVA